MSHGDANGVRWIDGDALRVEVQADLPLTATSAGDSVWVRRADSVAAPDRVVQL